MAARQGPFQECVSRRLQLHSELKPGQVDQDSLPPYDVLDAILEHYIEAHASVDAIVEAGFDRATVERIAKMVDRNEYKRRQAAPGLRVSPKAFGIGRRLPIVMRRTRVAADGQAEVVEGSPSAVAAE